MLIDEKINLEYQGSGHNLDVKLGNMTEEEFLKKEISRFYYLKSKGWRMIEVVSKTDTLPSKEDILKLFELSKEYLTEGSYVGFFLDENKIKFKGKFYEFDFELKIATSNLKNII